MKFIVAKNAVEKAIGLCFRSDFKDALVLEMRWVGKWNASIHTFFMLFPIDIYFLDKNQKIVEVRKNVMPSRIVKPRKPVLYVVETKAGKAHWKLGERLKW